MKSKESKSFPSQISLHAEIRRRLQRGSRQGAAYVHGKTVWPNLKKYAEWTERSHRAISKIANGETEKPHPDLLDLLAYLTGVYPDATEPERKARLSDAERWRMENSIRKTHPTLPDYLAKCYWERGAWATRPLVRSVAQHPGTRKGLPEDGDGYADDQHGVALECDPSVLDPEYPNPPVEFAPNRTRDVPDDSHKLSTAAPAEEPTSTTGSPQSLSSSPSEVSVDPNRTAKSKIKKRTVKKVKAGRDKKESSASEERSSADTAERAEQVEVQQEKVAEVRELLKKVLAKNRLKAEKKRRKQQRQAGSDSPDVLDSLPTDEDGNGPKRDFGG